MTKLAPNINHSKKTNGLNSLIKRKSPYTLQDREHWWCPVESQMDLLFSPEMPPPGTHSSGLTRWSRDPACIIRWAKGAHLRTQTPGSHGPITEPTGVTWTDQARTCPTPNSDSGPDLRGCRLFWEAQWPNSGWARWVGADWESRAGSSS